MANRNIWTYGETNIMLKIIDEHKCLEQFDGKKYRNSEIYEMIEKEMHSKGYSLKNAQQIKYRWKNLKRDYIREKRNTYKNGRRPNANFYDEIEGILEGRSSSISNRLEASPQENSSEPLCEKVFWQSDPLETYTESSNPSSCNTSKCRRKRRDHSLNEDVLIQCRNEGHTEDEFDVVGKHFAFKLRKLPNKIRITTEKLMTDIIYQAELGIINSTSTITINNGESSPREETV